MPSGTSGFLTGVLLVASFGLLAFVADGCKGDDNVADGALCSPGDNIFCRCPGGAPGTKSCNEAGDGFGSCETCDEPRESTGPGQQSSSSGFGGGGPGVGGGGGAGSGGGTGNAPLLSYCDGNGDCQSGACQDHFCTKSCTLISECPYPASECVKYGGKQLCMPTCSTAVDCSLYGAPPSLCGYTKAIDAWDVTVCAEWGSNHQLMPHGTDCLPFDHHACNLGYQGREEVCSEKGICEGGCYLNVDCPMGKECSSQGALGQCQ